MPSRFNYQPRTSDQWRKRESGSTYMGFALDSFTTFSPKKENWIRICPPTWENPQHYGLDIWVHYGVGPENATPLCLYKMGAGKCPICEAYDRATAAGREDAKELRPTRRVLVWIIDRKEEKKENRIKLWAMPQSVDVDISKICRDRITGELYQIDNPDAGYDLTFDKEGEKINTKYTGFQLLRQASAIEDDVLEYILKNPVQTTLSWRTYEEVAALFEGQPAPGSIAPPASVVASTSAPTPQPTVQTAPPPPVVQAPTTVQWPPEGWTAHPSAPGYYYKGQEVLNEEQLKAKFSAPPPPPVPPVPVTPPVVVTPPIVATTPVAQPAVPPTPPKGGDAAAALRARFSTGRA
jgi:hypothetical protein